MPELIAGAYSTCFYKTCYILTFTEQKRPEYGYSGRKSAIFCFCSLFLAFWHPDWHPKALKEEKSRDIKGYEPI